MNDRTATVAGLVGTTLVLALAALGVYGFLTGYAFENPGELFAPSMGVLAITAAVVGALILVGARSRRWRENPYW